MSWNNWNEFSGLMSSIPIGTKITITVRETGTADTTDEDIALQVKYPDGLKIVGHGSTVDMAARKLKHLYELEIKDGFRGLHNKKVELEPLTAHAEKT